jgi:hypothetical protein
MRRLSTYLPFFKDACRIINNPLLLTYFEDLLDNFRLTFVVLNIVVISLFCRKPRYRCFRNEVMERVLPCLGWN